MEPPAPNAMSVLGRDLLLVEVGGGGKTHLVAEREDPPPGALHPELGVKSGRWAKRTLCGRYWMPLYSEDALAEWGDLAVAPTCRACVRHLDSWFPSPEMPPGIENLTEAVTEEVASYGSAAVVGVPAEHVEATRRAIRAALRAAGMRSNTHVSYSVIHVWSADSCEEADPSVDDELDTVDSWLSRIIGTSEDDEAEPAEREPISWAVWMTER